MGCTLRRHRTAALLFAALQVGLSFGFTANLVLCRTPAGQIEIESAIGGGCCPSHGVPEQAHGADDCGCIDTPLVQTPLDSRSQLARATMIGPPALAALPATFLPVPSPGPVRLPVHPPGPPLDSLTAIRSVVLLV